MIPVNVTSNPQVARTTSTIEDIHKLCEQSVFYFAGCAQKELAELEEKWKKAMMNNAQLDNEKQTYRYQVDLLKDTLEEMEEQLIELQREHKDRCRVRHTLKQ